MRKAHQILAYLLAAEVAIQAMAIAYALAGLGPWIENDSTTRTCTSRASAASPSTA